MFEHPLEAFLVEVERRQESISHCLLIPDAPPDEGRQERGKALAALGNSISHDTLAVSAGAARRSASECRLPEAQHSITRVCETLAIYTDYAWTAAPNGLTNPTCIRLRGDLMAAVRELKQWRTVLCPLSKPIKTSLTLEDFGRKVLGGLTAKVQQNEGDLPSPAFGASGPNPAQYWLDEMIAWAAAKPKWAPRVAAYQVSIREKSTP